MIPLRVWMVSVSAIVALAVAGSGAVVAQDKLKADLKTDELAIVSWGGSYQEAQRKAYFDGFAQATGIRVREDTGPQIERSRAEVQSGSPTFDLTATNQTFYLIGLEQDLWTPLDYSYFDKADLDAMSAEVKKSHGVGTIFYSEGMVISTQAFPDGKPQPSSWADFFDVEKFPGRRGLPKCSVGASPLPEAAAIAMGATRDNLYPIDMKKAAERLRELSEHVIFWDNQAQPGQMLASGEIVMTAMAQGRAQALIDKGAPMKVVWEGQRHTYDQWYVLKGAKNVDNAMRFVAYASRPEPQAMMAKLLAYAPTNARAFELIDDATAQKLVTHPDNYKKAWAKNEAWWKENREKWVETCSEMLLH
jgi:putative spermidine/putrescine transport system substrate-binding protein